MSNDRYYLCKIIGDGGPPPSGSPYRAAIEDVIDPATGFAAFEFKRLIGTDESGQPLRPWCLVHARGARHSLVIGNPDIDPLPVFGLDSKILSMHTPTKNKMGADMQARGINTAFVALSDGYRDVLTHLGKLHDPAFELDDFLIE